MRSYFEAHGEDVTKMVKILVRLVYIIHPHIIGTILLSQLYPWGAVYPQGGRGLWGANFTWDTGSRIARGVIVSAIRKSEMDDHWHRRRLRGCSGARAPTRI